MTNRKRTTQEVLNGLWKACDSVRGRIEPSCYRDIVLSILFIKYISDIHKATLAANKLKYGEDEKRIELAMRYARFNVPGRSSFDYLYQRRHESLFGDILNVAFAALHKENWQIFTNEQGHINWYPDFMSDELGNIQTRNELLQNLFEIFAELDLSPGTQDSNITAADIFTFLTEHLIYEAGLNAGEYFTPKEVCSLLAEIIKSKPGSRIYDPAAGTGGLLIEAARKVGNSNFSLYGQEINSHTWAISKMNMLLHELDNTTICWGDTLRDPGLKENNQLMKFDVVLSHPPFSLSNWGAEEARNDKYNRFYREIPPDSKADWAFISHMLAVAREDKGKVAVIVPHGVLFRAGAEGRIRKRVIEEMSLEAVIGLPANLFHGTANPAAILLFDKAKKTGETLFIDASREYEKEKKQHRLREAHIRHITDTYTRFKSGKAKPGVLEEKYAYIATIEEISKNEYNLNLTNYVNILEKEEKKLPYNLHEEINKLEEKLADIQNQLAESLKKLNL